MTYSIELTQEDDRLLRQRATEVGKTPAELILDAVRYDNRRVTEFDRRRDELAENFSGLGQTDDELADELEAIKQRMRNERRGETHS